MNTEYLFTNTAPLTALPMSIAGWFKSTNDTADQAIAFLGDKDVINNYHLLFANGSAAGDGIIARSRDATATSSANDGNYEVDTWTHAAGVWASTTSRKAYFNGITPDEETTSRTPTGIDRFAIGAVGASSISFPFDGKIAYVGIWNVALSDGEVASLAGGAHPLTVQNAAIVAFYRCFDNINDSKGTNHLTANGTVSFDTGDEPTVNAPPSTRRPVAPIIFD